jgi:hypothetical protein
MRMREFALQRRLQKQEQRLQTQVKKTASYQLLAAAGWVGLVISAGVIYKTHTGGPGVHKAG